MCSYICIINDSATSLDGLQSRDMEDFVECIRSEVDETAIVTYCLCSTCFDEQKDRRTWKQAHHDLDITNVRRASEGNASRPNTAPACVCISHTFHYRPVTVHKVNKDTTGEVDAYRLVFLTTLGVVVGCDLLASKSNQFIFVAYSSKIW